MDGLNKVTLLGTLGADPILHGAGERSVLKLRMVTNESYFDKQANERKERTEWHNVVLFGKRAEALSKILVKGASLLIEGALRTSSYEKDGVKIWKTEIAANNIILTGGRSQREQPPADQEWSPTRQVKKPLRDVAPRKPNAQAEVFEEYSSDDLPF